MSCACQLINKRRWWWWWWWCFVVCVYGMLTVRRHWAKRRLITALWWCTLSLQAQNLLFQQILSTLDLLDCFTIMGLNWTYHAHQFIFSFSHFNFLFIPCGRLSFLLHVKYTLSYRISYRMPAKSVSDNWLLWLADGGRCADGPVRGSQ